MIALFACAALAAGGATPRDVFVAVEAAMAEKAPWKVIDYVVPEDQPAFLAGMDMVAGMAAWNADPAKAELEAIHTKYGVVAPEVAPTDSETFAEAIEVQYAAVTDPAGLAEALWTFASTQGTPTQEPGTLKLVGGKKHPALKLGKQKTPLIVGPDGRWYVDLPDPSLAAG